MSETKIRINTDGGSRGNPGPAAAAFTVCVGSKTIHEHSSYLGRNTNNFAEYCGVIIALEWLQEFLNTNKANKYEIEFNLDSELVVKQLNGEYKIKDKNLLSLFNNVQLRLNKISNIIRFIHVPRNLNKRADFLVNQELNSVDTLV